MSDLLDAALTYARLGWRVFPCEPGEKRPLARLAPQGLHNSTTSAVTIRAWWAEEPYANVGVATGEGSGLLVVDVDDATQLWTLEAEHGQVHTVESRTGGGGTHLWLAYPRVGRFGNTAGKIAPGIDTRGEGGYVVAPPSVTEKPYLWRNGPETPLADAPEWLLELLRDKPVERTPLAPVPQVGSKYAEKALADEIAAVAMATEGSRNDTLNSAAFSLGQLVGAGLLTEDQVEYALVNAARSAGLPEREAHATVQSGLRAGMREPRNVPPPRNSGGPPPLTPTEIDALVSAIPNAPTAPANVPAPPVVEPATDDLLSLRDVLGAYIDGLNAAEGAPGVQTGFADLDTLTGGLKAGDLVVLAARPSVGKSALAFNLARNAAQAGVAVLIFSLEMSAHQIAERLLAAEAQVDATRLRTGRVSEAEWQRVSQAFNALSELPIWLKDDPSPPLGKLVQQATTAVESRGIGLVVVDYIGLVRVPGQRERRLEVGEVSRGLKALARDCKVPVLALSQLNRAVEARQDHRPLLSDLRESGDIEQDSDLVMLLHREEVFNPNTDRRNVADLIIAKHRNGPQGSITLRWFPAQLRFANIEVYRAAEGGW